MQQQSEPAADFSAHQAKAPAGCSTSCTRAKRMIHTIRARRVRVRNEAVLWRLGLGCCTVAVEG